MRFDELFFANSEAACSRLVCRHSPKSLTPNFDSPGTLSWGDAPSAVPLPEREKVCCLQVLLHLLGCTAAHLDAEDSFLELALALLADSSLPGVPPSVASSACLRLSHMTAACGRANNRQACFNRTTLEEDQALSTHTVLFGSHRCLSSRMPPKTKTERSLSQCQS